MTPILSCSTWLATIKSQLRLIAFHSHFLKLFSIQHLPVAAFPVALRLPFAVAIAVGAVVRPIAQSLIFNLFGYASLDNVDHINIYSRMPSGPVLQIEMLLLVLMISAVAGYDTSVNYWEAFAPGKLLQRLDALTLMDKQPPSEVQALAAQLPTAQAKIGEGEAYDDDENTETHDESDTDTDTDDAYTDTAAAADADASEHDDDADPQVDSHSVETHSGEDYERNYEQFVRQYFDRVPDDDDDDDVAEHDAQLDASVETQAEASNLQQKGKHRRQHKAPRCRRVRRNGQLCEICREPRNNEVSETCSYSHEAQPKEYAYDSGTQYKRYRDEPSAEQSIVQPVTKHRQRSERQKNGGKSEKSGGVCVRHGHGNSVCYECTDSAGQILRRCYDATMNKQRKTSFQPRQPHAQQSKKSAQEQRIYKRTVSYSYAQGSAPNDMMMIATTLPTPTMINDMADMATTDRPQRRRLGKVVRRRVALPHSIV